jgi:hypothetical protein
MRTAIRFRRKLNCWPRLAGLRTTAINFQLSTRYGAWDLALLAFKSLQSFATGTGRARNTALAGLCIADSAASAIPPPIRPSTFDHPQSLEPSARPVNATDRLTSLHPGWSFAGRCRARILPAASSVARSAPAECFTRSAVLRIRLN